MRRKKVRQSTKGKNTSADMGLPNFLIAASLEAAIIDYTEPVFNAARDSNDRTDNIPLWRVHVGSECLGSLASIFVLFCLKKLGYKSKNLAMRPTVGRPSHVGITGVATDFHIPIMIVLVSVMLNGMWVYRQFDLERRMAD